MTSNYTLPNGRQIQSEVLLKLEPDVLSHLPIACKTCPEALWQLTGKPETPDKLSVRNYCRVMHTFVWDSRTKEEILDCDQLYEPEEDEDAKQEKEKAFQEDLPPFLREKAKPSTATPHPQPVEEERLAVEDMELPGGLSDDHVEL